MVFRDRRSTRDLKMIRELERFHYRGKGLNKIVGRRTVLVAEIEQVWIVGYGVLSASVPAVGPRFDLFKTNFKEQMTSGLINRVVRIPRIVIHPEFRGIHLGILMVKHLVNYVKEYWDINHYKPIVVEVIGAMTDYHKFFEKVGFISIGYTKGYRGNAVIPKYGNGSFAERDSSRYDFLTNQEKKPYLVYPIYPHMVEKLAPYRRQSDPSFLPKRPLLGKRLEFKRLSLKYRNKNMESERTKVIRDVFGVDSE
ncbi:MAG: hypothetical protein NZ583_08215 [Desulfobacterota bacterium]|nr:hypothetical protein [Thermodesulfobacteriota bacterium]MDW8002780.1 hypothetical protein [Deltaproteobacteria bacterium]